MKIHDSSLWGWVGRPNFKKSIQNYQTRWYDNKCKPFIYIYEKKKVTAKYKGEISTSTFWTQLVKQVVWQVWGSAKKASLKSSVCGIKVLARVSNYMYKDINLKKEKLPIDENHYYSETKNNCIPDKEANTCMSKYNNFSINDMATLISYYTSQIRSQLTTTLKIRLRIKSESFPIKSLACKYIKFITEKTMPRCCWQ